MPVHDGKAGNENSGNQPMQPCAHLRPGSRLADKVLCRRAAKPRRVAARSRGQAFQLSVWEVLAAIPYGKTVTYGWVAERVGENRGKRTSARAVGGAVGANPLGIVIPCHRVIGANGSLTGFGGGLEAKVALLELEGVAMSRGTGSEAIETPSKNGPDALIATETPSEFNPDALTVATRLAKSDTACKAIRDRQELMS